MTHHPPQQDKNQERCCECYCHTVSGTGKCCIACPDEFVDTQNHSTMEGMEELKIRLYNFGRMSDRQELSDEQERIEELV